MRLTPGLPAKSFAVVSPWHTVHSTPPAPCGLAFHWSYTALRQVAQVSTGWNQPMNNVRGLILLSNGGLDGSSRKEENEQGGTEHYTRGNDSWEGSPECCVPASDRWCLTISDTYH